MRVTLQHAAYGSALSRPPMSRPAASMGLPSTSSHVPSANTRMICRPMPRPARPSVTTTAAIALPIGFGSAFVFTVARGPRGRLDGGDSASASATRQRGRAPKAKTPRRAVDTRLPGAPVRHSALVAPARGAAGISTLAVVLPSLLEVQRQHKREKLLQYAARVWSLSMADETLAIEQAIEKTAAFFRAVGLPIGETNEPKPEPAFLMEMLEDREALAEARAKKDFDRVAALGAVVEGRMKKAEAKLAAGFAREGAAAADVRPLLPVLGELRFYRRFLDEVSAIEDEALG